jgi:thiamine biosynthesis protein ThiS
MGGFSALRNQKNCRLAAQSRSVTVQPNASTQLNAPRGVVQGRVSGLSPRVVAVELNREVVEPDKLDDVMVNAGDEMEIVHFVGGG